MKRLRSHLQRLTPLAILWPPQAFLEVPGSRVWSRAEPEGRSGDDHRILNDKAQRIYNSATLFYDIALSVAHTRSRPWLTHPHNKHSMLT